MEQSRRLAGREPGTVQLVSVSKMHPLSLIRDAYALGQRAFGENYVQEAVDKVDAWSPEGLEWHFIGRIQSNKVKLIANRFVYVHSIERFEIAERLNAATTGTQKIFIQYNVAGEDSKAGAGEAEVRDLVAKVSAECPRLIIVGLMVMPPMNDNPEATRPYFKRARTLLDDLKAKTPSQPLDQLSMGTSGDFEVAIDEGATWIRIGTEIFGARPSKA